MDYGALLKESFGYAKEGLAGKWVRCVLLIAMMPPSLPLFGFGLPHCPAGTAR